MISNYAPPSFRPPIMKPCREELARLAGGFPFSLFAFRRFQLRAATISWPKRDCTASPGHVESYLTFRRVRGEFFDPAPRARRAIPSIGIPFFERFLASRLLATCVQGVRGPIRLFSKLQFHVGCFSGSAALPAAAGSQHVRIASGRKEKAKKKRWMGIWDR